MRNRSFQLFTVLLLLALVVGGCTRGSSQESSNPEGQILFITDLHFTPFQDKEIFDQLEAQDAECWETIFRSTPLDWGDFGQATTPWLFLSLVNHLEVQAAQADMVFFLGDVLAHHFDRSFYELSGSRDQERLRAFIRKTYRFFVLSLAKALPGKRIIFSLGNNDFYCGDYQVQPDGPFLTDLAGLLSPYMGLGETDRGAFEQTFFRGGYYSFGVPENPDHRIIVLNAVFFSDEYANTCGQEPDTQPGWEELAWLELRLEEARQNGQTVWLLSHIPPGLDIFGTVRKHLAQGRIDQVEDFWTPEFGASFQELLGRYPDVIQAIFSGHTHQDDFRVRTDIRIFDKIFPSCSPVFDNNPGFVLAFVDRHRMEIRNFQTYYLDLAATRNLAYGQEQWTREYDFKAAFDLDGLNAPSMAELHQAIQDDAGKRRRYETWYDVSNEAQDIFSDQDLFQAYWCGQNNWEAEGFLECFNNR